MMITKRHLNPPCSVALNDQYIPWCASTKYLRVLLVKKTAHLGPHQGKAHPDQSDNLSPITTAEHQKQYEQN